MKCPVPFVPGHCTVQSSTVPKDQGLAEPCTPNVQGGVQDKCYFCNKEIIGPIAHHHPDKKNFPDWTEPAHADCHHEHHQAQGHFVEWGRMSSTAGRSGYKLTLERCPTFHHLGGKARARSARRNPNGTFA